jgi:uncharacterized RDD family membrane protein YckC
MYTMGNTSSSPEPVLTPDPSLIQPLIPSLIKGVILSLVVVLAMFFFTYLPQVAVLAFVTGPLAFVAAVPLVLGEAYFVILFLTKGFLMGQIGVDLFDAVSLLHVPMIWLWL